MNRRLFVALVVCCAASVAHAEAPTLKEARQRWLKGNYTEARAQYEALAKDPKQKAVAAIGLSRVHQSEGEYDKALAVVEAALKDDAKNADLHARRAELLHFTGRWGDAEKAANSGLAVNPRHFLARWVLAQVYRDRSEFKKADAEFRWFVRTYTERSNADDDIKDPDELLIVGLAACEYTRWNILNDKTLFEQFDFVLNEVYKDAVKHDKNFWPAEYEMGMLLLERHGRADEIITSFDNALTVNPNAAEALVGKGVEALQKLELKKAEQFAEHALRVNPNLPGALRLRADVHLAGGDAAAALKELDSARKVNPRDEETLGQVAACYYLQRKQPDIEALVKEIEKYDPKPGVFHHALAERLEARRRFLEAEKHYQKAIELRPMLAGPRTSLGMLYMRLGRETEAAEILEKAFQADPSNTRVSNMRLVLKHLEKYQTITTEHYTLRYDPKNDPILARYMAEYLEGIYADLAQKFNYRPKGPILVEMFNNHEKFSGRVIALPDLHTIGACTGRMMALVSPNGKGILKPFNWGRVLRHEIVHIFNLDQTQFLVPHWLTEGLAVINEGYPRPQPWNQLLLERVPTGKELYNLDNIDMGFIRPKHMPDDWHMAYCQAQLYVEYMTSTYGKQTVGELLAAYADGLETAAAVTKACKVDKETFEKGYRKYLEDTIKTLKSKPAEKPLTFNELKEAYKNDPANADLAARLAEQNRLRKNTQEARELAKAALNKNEKQPIACYVLYQLEKAAGRTKEALEYLEQGFDKNAPERKVLMELGKIYYSTDQFDKAAEMFELGHKAEPYDSQWLIELTRVYAKSGDKDKHIAALIKLVPTDADDLDHRKRLARLLEESSRHAEAERYARECMEINIRDKEAREVLFKALEGQKKDAEVAKLRKILDQ
jgi:tetratricopeptide (TPR) repeat protein